jgi:hypothetical protein
VLEYKGTEFIVNATFTGIIIIILVLAMYFCKHESVPGMIATIVGALKPHVFLSY